MKLILDQIVNNSLIDIRFFGDPQVLPKSITGVSIDSRTVKDGEIFFAIAGDNFDGHNFVNSALKQGAIACMVSEQWFEQNSDRPPGNYLVVKDSLLGFQAIARYYRAQFTPRMIAITGSTGKTTAKEMAFHVLAEKYHVLRNIKSFNNHVGVPLTLFRLQDTHEVVIVEIGTNHFGEIAHLAQIADPGYGMITNIGYGHLEFLGSLDGVARAKMELFEYIGKNGVIFYNADDATLARYKIPVAKKVITFGIENRASINGNILNCDSGARYTFEFQGEKIQLSIPGRHNVYNALAAAALGVELQVPVELIKKGLEKFTAVEKRMEVFSSAGILIINDTYNNNPSSAAAALQTLADITGSMDGRKIVVMGDMAELGQVSRNEHFKIGKLIGNMGFTKLLAYGEQAQFMAQSAGKSTRVQVKHYTDKTLLIADLARYVQPGDVVLVKGSRVMAMEDVVTGLTRARQEKINP